MRTASDWLVIVVIAFGLVYLEGDAVTAFVDDVAAPEADAPIERHHEFDCIADSGDPGPAPLRRLTLSEYINTVQSVFDVDITADAERYFPRDIRADGFNNTAYNLTVDLGHIQAYARLADIVVGQIDVVAFVDEFASARELTDENMSDVITRMGTWVLRGPLNEHEVETYLNISRAVAEEEGEFRDAVGYVLRAMLQSPRFLYLIENRQGNGAPRLLGDYELAARMSYILWGAPPDRELMQAAENGELLDAANVQSQVERMLQDPRSVERSRQFITEWLDLDRLSSLRPNHERFPTWNDQLAADMREETLAYFTELAWQQDQPLTELMHAQFTYATPRLAAHYGLPWNEALGYSTSDTVQGPQRNTEGLLALYTFHEREGETIHDVSEAGDPLHLQIPDRDAVQWTDAGLQITSPTWISTATSSAELVDAIKSTQEFSLEAWVTPANTEQTGPAHRDPFHNDQLSQLHVRTGCRSVRVSLPDHRSRHQRFARTPVKPLFGDVVADACGLHARSRRLGEDLCEWRTAGCRTDFRRSLQLGQQLLVRTRQRSDRGPTLARDASSGGRLQSCVVGR